MGKGKLTLKRFNGIEEFEISDAEICAWEDQGKICLNLEISTNKAIATLPDTREIEALPNAEVTIRLDELKPSSLIGNDYIVENGLNEETEELDGRFYYCEHQSLNQNIVKFLSKDENLFSISWSGITNDINYYDGSKPDSEILIEAIFSFSKSNEWNG
jgi:hypothetical protein